MWNKTNGFQSNCNTVYNVYDKVIRVELIISKNGFRLYG